MERKKREQKRPVVTPVTHPFGLQMHRMTEKYAAKHGAGSSVGMLSPRIPLWQRRALNSPPNLELTKLFDNFDKNKKTKEAENPKESSMAQEKRERNKQTRDRQKQEKREKNKQIRDRQRREKHEAKAKSLGEKNDSLNKELLSIKSRIQELHDRYKEKNNGREAEGIRANMINFLVGMIAPFKERTTQWGDAQGMAQHNQFLVSNLNTIYGSVQFFMGEIRWQQNGMFKRAPENTKLYPLLSPFVEGRKLEQRCIDLQHFHDYLNKNNRLHEQFKNKNFSLEQIETQIGALNTEIEELRDQVNSLRSEFEYRGSCSASTSSAPAPAPM